MSKEGCIRCVILLQLGTPDELSVRSVRRYLNEFLMDPCVINLPWFLRAALVKGVILPFRTRKAFHSYQKIWDAQGSPLRKHTHDLCDQLNARAPSGTFFKFAMRYGNPSLYHQVKEAVNEGAKEICFLPLYPQRALSTTVSCEKKIREVMMSFSSIPYEVFSSFSHRPEYIEAVVHTWTSDVPVEHVVFSFHGVPLSQLKHAEVGSTPGCHLEKHNCCAKRDESNQNCYRAQCFSSASEIAASLQLQSWSVAFQSRLGRSEWTGPQLADELHQLRSKGIRRIAIYSPSFVADCLETLEEIGMRTREFWVKIGGEELIFIPSLNSTEQWVDAILKWVS
jgi:ferrochelatase